MVTREQFVNGIGVYIENEIAPHLPTSGKWGIGTVYILLSAKSSALLGELSKNQFIRAMGLITDDGLINLNALSDAAKRSADKYGAMTITVPILGNLTFSAEDIEKLKDYIEGKY